MMLGLFIPLKTLSAAAFEYATNVFSRVNLGIKARFILASLIALLFTASVLQWSFHSGRLAYDMTYDDVSYFQDAYLRVKVLYEQGLGTMITGLFHTPPHSPYSTLLAFIGFALFGPRDWVPYFMNSITIFLFLGFLAYILRNIHFIISAMIIMMFLFVPLSFFAVHEFRPDYVVALFSCAFSFLAFEHLLYQRNHGALRLRCAGVAFGLALLSKPSFFAHTLALAFAISVLIMLHHLLANYPQWKQETRKRILSILGDFYLPAIVLAVPYYALNWRHVLDYFLINTRGQFSEIWNFKESYWEVFKSFTVVDPGSRMISSYLFFFSGIVIFSMLFLFHKRKWHDAWLLTGLMAVAIGSLGIVVYGRHNNPYFGLTYQMMLCLATCYCLSSLRRDKLCFALILSTFILFTGWYMASKPLFSRIGNQTFLARKGSSTNLKIINAIENHLRGLDSNNAPIQIFFCFAGEVNASSSQWLSLQKSLPLEFSDLHTQQDIAAYKKAVLESDFVVVADEDADGIYRWLPSYIVQRPVLDFLRMQPAMQEIMVSKTSKDVADGYIRLFANKSHLQKKELTVFLPYRISGFLPPEGPYPQWKLPVVRWGLYPESQILLPDRLRGGIKIRLSARGKPGTALVVTHNRVEIYRHLFKGSSFEDIAIPLSVSSGQNAVGFQYEEFSTGEDGINRTILFQNIRITSSE